MEDAELAVLDDDGDDLPAVDVAEVDLYSGDHHAVLAGDHLTSAKLVHAAAGAADCLERVAEVVGPRIGGAP